MKVGWLYDDNYQGWFYLQSNGMMKTGWLYDQEKNSWYYLKENGIMATAEITPDGYYVNEEGIWIP